MAETEKKDLDTVEMYGIYDTEGESDPGHSHSCFEIIAVLAGEGALELDGNTFILTPGMVFVIAPGQMHSIRTMHALGLRHITFPAVGDMAVIFAEIGIAYLPEGDMRTEFSMLCSLLSHRLGSISRTPPGAYIRSLAAMLSACAEGSSHIRRRWEPLLRHLQADTLKITLDGAAAFCGITKSYLCRSFKRDFHITFMQYVDLMRLEKAKDLLLATDMNIYDIVTLTGISSAPRFFRTFRAAYGVTPHTYRRRMREKNGGQIGTPGRQTSEKS
ncbi:MAG: AraC family transcriptional regulator [Clostridia bacterium]|nr:AraC family transcriptional regulator [Clostridia bacterium]